MVAPPRYYKMIREQAEAGDPFAKQAMRLIKAEAIAAVIALPFLLYVIWKMIGVMG